jgi:hypothetical protein
VLRSFDLTIARWPDTMWGSVAELPGKWLYALPRAIKHIATAPSAFTGWLALIALGGLARRTGTHPPNGARVGALMLVPLALMVGAQHRPEFVMTVLPVWALLAVLGLGLVARRAGHGRPAIVLLLTALLVLPGTIQMLRRHLEDAGPKAAWLSRERAALDLQFGAGRPGRGGPASGPVLSDTPGFVAWETGRTTVWMAEGEWRQLRLDIAAGTRLRPRDFPDPAETDTWFHEDPRALRP